MSGVDSGLLEAGTDRAGDSEVEFFWNFLKPGP